VAPADDDQLPPGLGVDYPSAAVRAGSCDARAVGADIDADDRADRCVRSRMLVEFEELGAGVDAPDARRPLASGGGDEPSAVRREIDVGVLVRPSNAMRSVRVA
jgi:hypothetical protein